MIGYSIFIVSVALSIACISYSIMARSNGWPVGAILAKDTATPKIAGFVTALWALVKTFVVFHWWSPIVVLVSGWLLALAITMAMKKNTQILCILGVFPAFIFTSLYVSESKPLGFLHRLLS